MRFLTKDKVKTMMETKKAMLVDMRSPVQFRDDPIPGAVNLPLRNLTNTLMLAKDKSKPVIIFGVRSDDTDVKMGVTYAENLSFDTYVTDLRQLRPDAKK